MARINIRIMKYRILVLFLGLLVLVMAILFYSEYATEREHVWKKLSEVDQALEQKRTTFTT